MHLASRLSRSKTSWLLPMRYLLDVNALVALTLKFTFVVDDQEVSKLPAWVKTAKQTTDGH